MDFECVVKDLRFIPALAQLPCQRHLCCGGARGQGRGHGRVPLVVARGEGHAGDDPDRSASGFEVDALDRDRRVAQAEAGKKQRARALLGFFMGLPKGGVELGHQAHRKLADDAIAVALKIFAAPVELGDPAEKAFRGKLCGQPLQRALRGLEVFRREQPDPHAPGEPGGNSGRARGAA